MVARCMCACEKVCMYACVRMRESIKSEEALSGEREEAIGLAVTGFARLSSFTGFL